MDRLAAVRDIFVENCKESYSLSAYVTIEEKLGAFKGKCSFRQYIPSKPAKNGLNLFASVDSKSFYTGNLEIYAGKQPEGTYSISNAPKDVVERLVAPIRKRGRNITADNWFSDRTLIEDLEKQKLSYVGTLKKINGKYHKR